jgi:fatty-acyl-CoA synthase
MNIPGILRHAVHLYGRNPAVRCEGAWTNYAILADRAEKIASALARRRIEPGSRVAALLPNVRPFLELTFAAPLAGAILVPLNPRLSPGELTSILNHSGASLLVAHARFAPKAAESARDAANPPRILWVGEPQPDSAGGEDFEAAIAGEDGAGGRVPCVEPGEDDPAHLYYTSGTTGRPKGVILSHRNVCTHALMAIAELSISDRDVWLHAAPMFHLADAWATFAVTWAGGRHVMTPAFDPGAVLSQLTEEGITLTNLVPTMLNALVRHPGAGERRYPSLRLLLSGGAPIAPALVRAVMATFRCEYWQTYGLTETSPYLTISRPKAAFDALPEEERFRYRACTGRPLMGVEVRVVDAAGNDVPADRRIPGEIVARGPTVTPGYWKDPDATAEAFRGGWFHTGDLAVCDPEGTLDIVDRIKDVIITGGEKVYSVEVEGVLCAHPGVSEAAVIGIPDETWGDSVKAVVVRSRGSAVDEQELIEHCRSRLAHFKAPKAVEFADALPRTGSGKVCKRELREACRGGGDPR